MQPDLNLTSTWLQLDSSGLDASDSAAVRPAAVCLYHNIIYTLLGIDAPEGATKTLFAEYRIHIYLAHPRKCVGWQAGLYVWGAHSISSMGSDRDSTMTIGSWSMNHNHHTIPLPIFRQLVWRGESPIILEV